MGRRVVTAGDHIGNSGLSSGTGAITVAAWFLPPPSATIFGSIASFNGQTGCFMNGAAYTLQAFYNNTQVGTSSAMTAGVWAHVAVVYNGTSATQYLNGVAAGGPTTIAAGSQTDFRALSDTFNENIQAGGAAADVAFWNTNLSAGQIAQLAAGYRPVDVNSANLQEWWPLSGYSSPEPDISGNANNGTLTGTTQAPMPPSISRGARSFDGTSNVINIGTPAVLDITANITVACWANITSLPAVGNYGILIEKGYDGSSEQYVLRIATYGGPITYFEWFTFASSSSHGVFAGSSPTASTVPATGLWHHFAGTFDGSNWKTWLDGTLQVSVADAQAPSHSTAKVSIGGADISGSFARFANANIADAAIWNTNLNSTQIAQLSAGVRPINVNSANLQGWWPLNGFTNSTESDLSSNANNGTVTPGSASGPFPILGPPQTWRLG
jgi:hypothetical protein